MITKHVVLSCENLKAKRSAPITPEGGGGGGTPIGGLVIGIHLPARCQDYGSISNILPWLWVFFCKFGPGYESALRRFALVMGKS